MHWVLKYRVFPLHHSASSGKRFPLAKFCDIHQKTTPRLYTHMAFPSNYSNSFLKDSLFKQLPLTNKLCTLGALRVFFPSMPVYFTKLHLSTLTLSITYCNFKQMSYLEKKSLLLVAVSQEL